MRLKITVIIIFLLLLIAGGGFYYAGTHFAGAGGSNIEAPESAKVGAPVHIDMVLSVWGGNGNIEGRYQDLELSYRLAGEQEYARISAEKIPLPERYASAQQDKKFYEAYRFTIPAYSKGKKGTIEYFVEMTFDGVKSKSEGPRPIPLTE